MQPLLVTDSRQLFDSSAAMNTELTDAPTEEQDLTVWAKDNEDEDSDQTPTKAKKWKGKGKAKAVDSDTDEENEPTGQRNIETDEQNEPSSYPPLNDEDREEKRVLENLRKWQDAERQKRRLNRDASISLSAQQTSVVGEVSRRATSLWNRGIRTRPSGMGSGSGHKVLSGGEDVDDEHDPAIPLSHVDHSPPQSPLAQDTEYVESPIQNPFEDPERLSRSDSSSTNGSAVMHSQPNTPAVGVKVRKTSKSQDKDPEASVRPVLQATTSFGKMSFKAPPPAPLILIPPPKTPPPHVYSQQTRSPSPPPPPPLPRQAQDDGESQPKAMRWWTDWICGCSEGPDRGGDNQAGRTNPFE